MTHIVLSSHYYKTAPKPGFLVDFIIEASFDGIGRENDGYAMIPGMITGYDWMILQKALLYIYIIIIGTYTLKWLGETTRSSSSVPFYVKSCKMSPQNCSKLPRIGVNSPLNPHETPMNSHFSPQLEYTLVNLKITIFLMENSLPSPTTARVYVNLPEGKSP